MGAPCLAQVEKYWVRDWDTVLDPPETEILPVVLELYVWLNPANSRFEV